MIAILALPLIYSVYLGVAEAARTLAVREAGRRREDPLAQALVGEMENELVDRAHGAATHAGRRRQGAAWGPRPRTRC